MYDAGDLIKVFFIGMIVAYVLTLGGLDLAKHTYKYGQIDAINGKIKYHLVLQNDGSTSWKCIDNEQSSKTKIRKKEGK